MTKQGRQFFLEEKTGDTAHQLPPRMTPTLVTPLHFKSVPDGRTELPEKLTYAYTHEHGTYDRASTKQNR